MAHIIYDNDQPANYNSARYSGLGSSGSTALLAIIILLILFFWADMPWLRDRINTTIQNVENSRVKSSTEIRHVAADNLNMREQPGIEFQATYILPRGTQVQLLGESQYSFDGDVWLRVRVETLEGPRDGWVSQRYIQ